MLSLQAKPKTGSRHTQTTVRHSKLLPASGATTCSDPANTALPANANVLRQLAKSIQAIETHSTPATEVVSTGCKLLDSELPCGGFARGSIIEWLSHGSGDGAFTLALQATKAAMGDAKHAIIIDPQKRFYPPAAKAFGIDLNRLIVLHPNNRADAIWSFDQSLRCPAIAAVITWQDHIDEINARRLQLAAEQGNALGLLLRNTSRTKSAQSSQTHWAEMTWQVTSMPAAPLPQANAARSDHTQWISQRPAGVPCYSDNYRWLHLKLKRMRAGRGNSSLASQIAADKASYLVAIDGHQGIIHARRYDHTQHREAQHDSSSALHLAAELAMPARRSRHHSPKRHRGTA